MSGIGGADSKDVTKWNGSAVATPTVAGVPEVDITHFGGTAGTFAGGRPEVNLTHWNGNALPAGAFSVRASSTQRGTITVSGATSNTASISSVTETRATDGHKGWTDAGTTFDPSRDSSRIALTAATTVTCTLADSATTHIAAYVVTELV